jgi:hypothetical protein
VRWLGITARDFWDRAQHAKTPVGYPQSISIRFAAPLKPKALWLQAQDHHVDRAPQKFSVYGCSGNGERQLLLRSRSKPSWDFTGWACWRFRQTNTYTQFEIVIDENCGNPELLTLQRLWFEPDSSSRTGENANDPGASSSGPRASRAEIAPATDDRERQQNPEYAEGLP